MMRFGWGEASVLRLETNEEFTASVTLDEDHLAVRRPTDEDVTVLTVTQAMPESAKRFSITTVEWGLLAVTRAGGCGCR